MSPEDAKDEQDDAIFESMNNMPEPKSQAKVCAPFVPIVPVIVESVKDPPKAWGVYGVDVDDEAGAAFLSKYDRECLSYVHDVEQSDFN